MRLLFIVFFLVGSFVQSVHSQSFWFGPKGGLALGTQAGTGSGSGGTPLIGYSAGFFIETLDEDKTVGSLYSSLSLSQRGRSSRSFISSTQNILVPGLSFRYNNISLQLGAKKFYKGNLFYQIGLRAEYTAWTNLDDVRTEAVSAFFPFPEFVRPLTGGITIGGGMQYDIGELYGMSIELEVHPDFYNQYKAPEIIGFINPVTGQPTTVRATEFRNTTLELKVAFRFLRKVEYY